MDYTSREEIAIWSIHFVNGTDTHLFNTYILSGCGNYKWWNTMRTNQSNIFRNKIFLWYIYENSFYVTMGSLYQNTYSTILLLWYHNGFDPDRFLPMEVLYEVLYEVLWYYDKFDLIKSLGVSYCQNATMLVCGAWIRTFFVLCLKNIKHTWLPVLDPPLVRDGPLGAPTFMKLAHCARRITVRGFIWATP